MAFRTTALLSVVAVVLSIVAHQSDPEIIPSLLAQGLDTFNEVTKRIIHYYDEASSYIHKTTGLEFFKIEKNKPINKKKDELKQDSKPPSSKGSTKPKLFTKEELRQYNGEEGSKGIYVAVLGGVFDVGSGVQHYGPGGGYHFFAGIDGTRAFVSGDFTETGLTDDVTGLPPKDLKALHGWYKFYEKDYTYVGKVVGRFYDPSGKRTSELDRVLKSVKEYERQEALEDKEKQKYPPCNVEWHKEMGSKVWCSPKSGGVIRSWAGVPRQLFEGSGKKSRCTCVEPQTAVSDPRLKEYEGCPPGADNCMVRDL